MTDFLFYCFALMTLISGGLVVLNPVSRNPVTGAMFLVLTMLSMAGLFVLLHAFFLAAVQILVYAGAVMVLFLFVIMLLDLRTEERRGLVRFSMVTGCLGVGVMGWVILSVLEWKSGSVAEGTVEGKAESLGSLLFLDYLLPFEILSVLLLVAMVGVILLSKKDLGRSETEVGS